MTPKQEPKLHICANEFCGKEFYPPNPLMKTCSKECAKLYKSQQDARRYHEGENRKNRKVAGTKAICVECGKEFVRKRNLETVCSQECRTERTRRLQKEWKLKAAQTIVCRHCEQEFVPEGCETYCCKECRDAAVAEKMVKTKQARAGNKYSATPVPVKPKKPKLTGKALTKAQGVWVSGMTLEQQFAAAEAEGKSYGKWKAEQQLKYEKEMGIGFYASK